MEMLKKIWKIALRVITGLLIILAVVLVANEIFGGGEEKEYYDVKNLKDYKTLKIKDMPSELQVILTNLEKDKGIDAGLEVLNLFNELDFKKDYDNSADKLKQIISIIEINTKYGNTERMYSYLYDFNKEIEAAYSEKESNSEKEKRIEKKAERLEDKNNKNLIKRDVKLFLSKMIQKAYEEQALANDNLLPEYEMWGILNYNGYNNIVFEQERRKFTASSINNIDEFRTGSNIDSRKAKLLLDADYMTSSSVNIKYKNSKINVTGNSDSNYNIYSVSVPISLHTYYLSPQEQQLTKNMKDSGSVLDEKEDPERAKFFKEKITNYILNNHFGWKDKALHNKIICEVLTKDDIQKLEKSITNISEKELQYEKFIIFYSTEINNKNVLFSFLPSFALDEKKYNLTGNPFDKNGIKMVVSMTVYDRKHSNLNDLIDKYVYPELYSKNN